MYKDSQQVSSSLVRSGPASDSDLHTLSIGGLTEADYGNYSCVARNSLGTSSDSILITGELSLSDQTYHYLSSCPRQSRPAIHHQPQCRVLHKHLQAHLDSLDPSLRQDPQPEHPIQENQEGLSHFDMCCDEMPYSAICVL